MTTRIPITMSHGIRNEGDRPMTAARFESLIAIAASMGFESINYDQLASWRAGEENLPPRPIMFDFDHGVRSILDPIRPMMDRFGFRGNLFIHTGPMLEVNPDDRQASEYMTWDEVQQLIDSGWHIGAHTVTHPNLSALSLEDPSGQRLRQELADCDKTLQERLGITPRDFAYTGTSFSIAAEREVAARYRFGRLWIVGSMYDADGQKVRYADLVGVPGEDEPDGGPPMAARYITRQTPAYRLPSMEMQRLIYEPDAFRHYLECAADTTA